MKKLLIGTMVAASASMSSISAFADDSDKDPCKVVVCMFGMVQGQHDQQCDDAINTYFGMVAWRHGHPDLSGTARNRLSFTQQCKSTDDRFTSMIDKAFGNVIR